jgi:hypothetical protein
VTGCTAGGRGIRRRALACLLAASAVGLAGCAPEPEVEWPADPTPAPSPTLDPAEAAAVEEILAAFDGFRRVEVEIQADPEPAYLAEERLTDYLADPLLSLTLFELETMHRRGVVRDGRPTWSATVTELRLDDDPPSATVRDCLDATGWELADRKDGRPASAEAEGLPARFAPDRYVMEFDATRVDGRWLFAQARVERGARC